MATHAGGLTATRAVRVRELVRGFGDADGPGRTRPGHRRGRVRRAAGPQRLRQEHPAARPGRPRPRRRRARASSSVPRARPRSSSRTPGCCRGSGSWTTSSSACAGRTPRSAAARPWPRSGWPGGSRPGPTSCPAASSSGSRWPGRWCREPELLLADEPFGALDALTRLRMHALLRELCARHRPAVLLVTHDVDEAITLADRVLVLDGGRIAVDLTIDLPAPRRHGAPEYAALRTRLLARLGVDRPGHV